MNTEYLRQTQDPKNYVCCQAVAPLTIDGKLDNADWLSVKWTENFTDIEGDSKAKPRFQTRVKMLWDTEYFYVGAELEEPHVWGTLMKRDTVIFYDNDFEVFVDPNGDNHSYYEFEMNVLNTGWDLFLPKPYRDDGHAIDSWNINGLKTAVNIQGTLNDPSDIDSGWSLEIAIPWNAFSEHETETRPPHGGEQWRINFSRVEWQTEIINDAYVKVKNKREDNWVWSPQGVVNMHRPEQWGYVQFSTSKSDTVKFFCDSTLYSRRALEIIYKAEKAYFDKHNKWTDSFDQLGLTSMKVDSNLMAEIKLTPLGFEASVQLNHRRPQRLHIRQDSLIW